MSHTPATPEHLLCLMNDLFNKAKEKNNREMQLKILPTMANLSMYLHAQKHKNGNYMTSPEAIRSLNPSECLALMDSIGEMIDELDQPTQTSLKID